ncbi:FtsQ-type POTRA domain-containing protein [Streptomyces sp. CAU 1734]|uniref:cell division protein FtsQ/DivIB n=1 Tax=Streptomyces sp. CAU 1734 TaxID=3140360 RepID=UPI0032603465
MAGGSTTAERGARRTPKGASGPRPGGPPSPPRGRFRLPGRRVLLTALAVTAVAAGVLWVLYGSSWARVERVRATGTDVLTSRQVTGAAGVRLGEPLVSVDTDAIEARLRGRLPRIESVEVSRSWPDGIVLEVSERRPVLLLRKGMRFVEVDRHGVRFATVGKAPRGVPMLELTVDRSPSLRRFPVSRLIEEAVRVTGELPAKAAADTRTLVVRSYDDISLELTGGRTVLWGGPEDGGVKARALTALMKAAPGARHYDVSAPIAPAASGS